ncbi:peptidylprolyl isomerase [Kordia algicida OT-1]|uniref:Periplasmic chaperone PpiD n=1 Tax=Kordia algicida OT-1 TaxID=391587 RepID=A9DK59_9FLAO|nr:peptidylprolyl isomerase [Kordia algicida]EDP98261.1 peptidyl-prolyl cis-trans isomerase [Kordia algicida OT-1]
MAILAKIRQRTLVLILIIGLALFAFVISDVFNNNGGGDKRPTEMGTVNGENIPLQQFQNQVEYAKNLSRGRQTTMQIVNSLWDEEVKNALITQQLDELGITIEKDEIWNLLITSPNITSSPQFQDESGTFVEGKLREYVNNLEAKRNLDDQSKAEYNNWVATEQYTIREAKKALYYNLVKAGSIATVKEGEMAYRMENDKVTFKYVQIPYTSIADSLVEVRKSDVQNYIENHKSEFEVKESRDIQYVFFPETPSKSDEEEAKQMVEDYKKGLAAAEDANAYANEYTETNESTAFTYSSQLPADISSEIMAMEVGDVYGPYKVGNQYKISRLVETSKLPDSVKSRHILIRFAGSAGAQPDLKRTKEEAKKTADSILTIVKRNKSKFADIAKEISDDTSKDKGGDLGWFTGATALTPTFKEFVFENETGDMGVVESPFGFHVIEIEDQKNEQKVVKLATINKQVEVTEQTLNDLFTTSSKFESDAGKSDDAFVNVAKERNYDVNPVNRIKELDASLAGMPQQREVIRWTFEEDTEVGDIRRFSVGSGFIVVQVTAKHAAGLASVEEASARVLGTLRNKKKAEMIKANNAGSKTLAELASAAGKAEQQATSLSMAAPIIPGAGAEKKVVGAAFALDKGATSGLIEGRTGVFMIQVVDKVEAPAKDTYLTEMNTLRNQRATKATSSVVEALKSSSEIEDNRGMFY